MSIDMQKVLDKFNEEYAFLYDSNENGKTVCGEEDALNAFDEDMKNVKFKKFVQEFVQYRKDFLVSDREVIAFEFTCESLGLFNTLLA